MSLFSVGGNAGLALGPAIVTPLALAFGLGGTPLVAVLPLAVAVVVGFELKRLIGFRPAAPTGGADTSDATDPDEWRPFIRLTLAIAARSVVFFGLTTLIPLYFVGELHTSEGTANTALTVMLASGAVGTLIGGRLADRFSRRIVLRVSLGVLTPLLVVMLSGGVGVAIGALAFIGAATIATFSVTVVMGQEYLPGRIGVASGVTLGLSIGIGGFGAPLLGLVADAHGVRAALEVVAALPLLALALALGLPRGQEANAGKRRERSRERSARRLAGWRQRRNGPSTRLPWL
jgi:FSR family fosmidomycin resistance protein-like MFS transporter